MSGTQAYSVCGFLQLQLIRDGGGQQGLEKAERQRYRREFQIIMKILECIIVESRQGKCYQTRIEQFANLQTEMRKFYLEKLENAGYVKRLEATWGRRPVNHYVMTEKGLERFRTLQTIEDELNPKKEGSKGK